MAYDVTIIGCGPAGIFSALKLIENPDLKILMLDMGREIEKRHCPSNERRNCAKCDPCPMLAGWGGAGSFSDGKLTISPRVGGWLDEYMDNGKLMEYINRVDQTFLKFGAPDTIYGDDEMAFKEIERKASLAGLTLQPMKIRHLGREGCIEVLNNIKKHLDDKVEIKMNVDVKRILTNGVKVTGVETTSEQFQSHYVVAAPGRVGASWLSNEAKRLNLGLEINPVDVGVRVETRAEVMEDLCSVLYEPKLVYYSKNFDDKVRTFCVNPNGFVTTETYDDITTVNGQSFKEVKSGNTNFAILVSTKFTTPFREPIAYGKYIAGLANTLAGGNVLLQRLGDIQGGRRSTKDRISKSIVQPTLKSAVPGDLSFVLPYRYLKNILELLESMDKLAPGVYSKDTLLYGVEVKFYSSRIHLTNQFETKTKNLFTIGDGAGITRGVTQSAASGLVAAEEILNRTTKS